MSTIRSSLFRRSCAESCHRSPSQPSVGRPRLWDPRQPFAMVAHPSRWASKSTTLLADSRSAQTWPRRIAFRPSALP